MFYKPTEPGFYARVSIGIDLNENRPTVLIGVLNHPENAQEWKCLFGPSEKRGEIVETLGANVNKLLREQPDLWVMLGKSERDRLPATEKEKDPWFMPLAEWGKFFSTEPAVSAV